MRSESGQDIVQVVSRQKNRPLIGIPYSRIPDKVSQFGLNAKIAAFTTEFV